MAHQNIDNLSLYRICREYLMHEDSLINIRLNWLLAIQTFLFAAYGLSEREMYELSNSTDLIPFINVLKVLGIVTSIIIFLAILSGVLAIKKLEKYWESKEDNRFPSLTGGGKQELFIDKVQDFFQVAFLAPCLISIAFSGAWIYLWFA